MKFCSNCGAQCEDNVVFCPSCGNSFDPAKASAASADPFDHTAEFDPKDISDNKVIAMLCYLLGSIGAHYRPSWRRTSPITPLSMCVRRSSSRL